MRDALHYLLGFLFLSVCCSTWAQSTPTDQQRLRVHVTGVSESFQKELDVTISHRRKLALQQGTRTAIVNFYEGIPKLIQKSLAPEGYFEPNVQSSIVENEQTWRANFSVTLGPRVYVDQVDVNITGAGKKDPVFLRLQKKIPIKVGEPFNAKKYNTAKAALFDVASARGYFEAKMTSSKAIIDLGKHTAKIKLDFNTGPRYRFGVTTFGPSPFKDSFLQRYINYKSGDYYNIQKIQSSREGLAGSDYFQQVIITPEMNDVKNRTVPLETTLSMQKPRQYTLGAGFGTDTGPRALVGTTFRWVNAYGHSVNTWLRFSQVNSSLSANYVIPGSQPATDRYIFTAGLQDFDQVTGSGKSGKLAFQYQTIIGGWQQTAGLTYLREKYQLTNFPETNADVLYPGISWQKKYTDELLNPNFGYNFTFGTEAANESLLSETTFWRAQGSGKILFTPFDGTRFLIRSSVGYIDVSDLESIPLSLQLFAGGAQSIRGYGYESIGPGRELYTGSVEIQRRIVGSWYAVAFVDAGDVADDILDEKLHVGTGPGFAWLSPIGIFEITFANAISQSNRPWVIQFVMGSVI